MSEEITKEELREYLNEMTRVILQDDREVTSVYSSLVGDTAGLVIVEGHHGIMAITSQNEYARQNDQS